MNEAKSQKAYRRSKSGKKDILIIAIIGLILVSALIFVLLKIIGHSEKHVEAVKKTKVHYKEALTWRPDTKKSYSRVLYDFKNARDKKEAEYGDLNLSEKSLKLIGKMYWLDSLKLTRANFQEKNLKHLKDLSVSKLSLHGTPVTDKTIKEVLKMKRLESVSLGDTDITDKGLEELSNSKTLKRVEIHLGRCVTNDGVIPIGKMMQLERLELSSCKKITGDCLTYITGLKNLKDLNIEGMKVKPKDLGHLSSLENLLLLDLSDCNLTDDAAAEISKVTGLKYLNINGNDFTDKGLVKLAKLNRLLLLSMKDCPYISQKGVDKFRSSHPACKIVYSKSNRLDKKLNRPEVKMELKWLKYEAKNELEKLKRQQSK